MPLYQYEYWAIFERIAWTSYIQTTENRVIPHVPNPNPGMDLKVLWELYCWMLASIMGSVSLNSVCSVPPDQVPAVSGPHKAPDFIERFGCWGLFLYLWLTDRNDGPQSELIISHTEQLSIWKSALTIIYNISILYQSSLDIRCLLNLFILFL